MALELCTSSNRSTALRIRNQPSACPRHSIGFLGASTGESEALPAADVPAGAANGEGLGDLGSSRLIQ
ncbi:MAG: hypothetical protein U1E02_12775, partial [Hydrogenophaga sp.]|nr:hypothetical protein [Hydrogenophaga sp.]